MDPLDGERGYPLPISVNSPGYANAILVKSGSGVLYGVSVYNSLASSQWIQLFDLAGLPADGVTPNAIYVVAASSNLGLDFGTHGRYCGLGIVLCNSTTGPTKTIGAANCFFDCQYV